MAAASLHGSSIPLDAGGFVVTVVCPNAYSHQRLMQALNSIVPDAGQWPSDEGNTAAPVREDYGNPVTPVVLADEVPADDDEGAPAEPPRTLPGEVGN